MARGLHLSQPKRPARRRIARGNAAGANLRAVRRERRACMSAFERILFPVDFSERCRHAARQAARLARRCDAELTALHVIDLPVSVYSAVGYEAILDLPAMRTAARKHLEEFVSGELEG